MVRAVIFDVDGTLIDSVDLHASAWKAAFERFGKQPSFAEVRKQIGKGGDQLMPEFFGPEELERFGEELERFRAALYVREYLPRARAFPCVRELVLRVREGGKRVALASSAKNSELRHYEQLAGIEGLVDHETAADDVARSKPYPDVFCAALAALGLPQREVIVVGDTPYDVEAAARAGLSTVALLCGGFPRAELESAGALAISREPCDLLANFERSPLA